MDFRRVERKGEDGIFTEIVFKDLKTGDEFRLFDLPGGPIHEDGTRTYKAIGDAYPWEPEGNYAIEYVAA